MERKHPRLKPAWRTGWIHGLPPRSWGRKTGFNETVPPRPLTTATFRPIGPAGPVGNGAKDASFAAIRPVSKAIQVALVELERPRLETLIRDARGIDSDGTPHVETGRDHGTIRRVSLTFLDRDSTVFGLGDNLEGPCFGCFEPRDDAVIKPHAFRVTGKPRRGDGLCTTPKSRASGSHGVFLFRWSEHRGFRPLASIRRVASRRIISCGQSALDLPLTKTGIVRRFA